jgi:hypothetical protein
LEPAEFLDITYRSKFSEKVAAPIEMCLISPRAEQWNPQSAG